MSVTNFLRRASNTRIYNSFRHRQATNYHKNNSNSMASTYYFYFKILLISILIIICRIHYFDHDDSLGVFLFEIAENYTLFRKFRSVLNYFSGNNISTKNVKKSTIFAKTSHGILGITTSTTSPSAGFSRKISDRIYDNTPDNVIYTPSEWEQIWLDNVKDWQSKPGFLCEKLLNEQRTYWMEFMEGICSTSFRDEKYNGGPHAVLKRIGKQQQESGGKVATAFQSIKKSMAESFAANKRGEWCLIDDTAMVYFFNRKSGEVRNFDHPTGDAEKDKYIPNLRAEIMELQTKVDDPGFTRNAQKMQNKRVFSFFSRTMPDGTVHEDFIEPLVGPLRHPLTCLGFDHRKHFDPRKQHEYQFQGRDFDFNRAYVVAPPRKYLENLTKFYNHNTNLDGSGRGSPKKLYFDAGATSWLDKFGSLEFFTTIWERESGIVFDKIEGWDPKADMSVFKAAVPERWKSKVTFHQDFITTSPKKQPFVPDLIEAAATVNDYVLFKLDIDAPKVEADIVDYLLRWKNLNLLDEFVWEDHTRDNEVMHRYWGDFSPGVGHSLADSYLYFLKLRQKGVRSHSWV